MGTDGAESRDERDERDQRMDGMDGRVQIAIAELRGALLMIVREISVEMERGVAMHPLWPFDPVRQAAIVAQEAGGLVRASLDLGAGRGDRSAYHAGAVRTAATAIRLLAVARWEEWEG